MANDLSALFLTRTPDGAVAPLMGAWLTAWNPTTYENTVNIGGAVILQNLPVVNPAGVAVGIVLLANTAAGPIILGRIYQTT
ncbi:hypothetical protein [Pseudonocardia asaccharolytica]|uniref:Uncharacterized protein n=1 Tax=Pseudonocardia asaccharolytica DSM 44247 = NBRC 16224 TaxID=1123024 RepID=A0A511CYR6_9PSEU|nr:hypothetical protein [Pseudonocardia asaccharolytica]GEL17699.1 hypothetical protein PA7_15360 [Pseudonocardia asaccharolytica DSM 44247 = NBRC 16224]